MLINEPMRLSAILLASAATVFAAPPVEQTLEETLTNTAYGEGSTVLFSFSQFDTSLGQLTGVTFTIDSIYLGGYFDVTSTSALGSLESFSSSVRVRQVPINTPAPDLGFSQYSTTVTDGSLSLFDYFTDNPVSLPLDLEQNTPTSVGIAYYLVVSDRVTNISNTKWSNYEGLGYVNLEFRNLAGVLQSGGTGSFDTSTVAADATITLKYTYIPTAVPEPSTYGLILGGLALVGAAVRRRKQLAK